MKIDKKLIVLVMSSSNPTYMDLEKSIKDTWYNIKNDDIEIIFYKDNNNYNVKSDTPQFDGCDLILPCGDGFNTLGIKTLMAFDWVSKNYNFDYVYRSNLGAYVDTIKMLKFLKDKPKDNFYCGIVGEDTYYYGFPVRFASGSGYFLSKDVVEIVLNNNNMWNHNVVDDVALGKLLSNFSIDVNESAIRLNYCDNNVFYNVGTNTVDNVPDDLIYHIRLRSDDRSIDINRMRELYKK
jgi:hypothetical protein